MVWLAIVYSFPSIIEAWFDRHGQGRAGKIRDTLVLMAVALILSILGRLYLNVPVLKSIALLLAWRILLFDYFVSYLLIRNGVIVGKWWSYSGKTTFWWDGIIAHIDWRLRLLIRVILFGVALVYYLVSPK